MGTAPRRGELRRKESQVHPTLWAPSRGSALLSLQRQPVPPSPSQLTPKLPASREPSINLPRKSHFMPKPCRLAHLMSSYRAALSPQPKLLRPWARPTRALTHTSRPGLGASPKRPASRAGPDPGNLALGAAAGSLGFGVLRAEGWELGARGVVKMGVANRKGRGSGRARSGEVPRRRRKRPAVVGRRVGLARRSGGGDLA